MEIDMKQQIMKQATTRARQLTSPRMRDIFFHLIKSAKLMGRLFTDRRIGLGRKALFSGSVITLGLILLFPDTEIVMGFIFPIIGAVLGVPVDAGIDWLVFSMALLKLLRIFPNEIVSEHYVDLFRKE
jgi:hypothetical protein